MLFKHEKILHMKKPLQWCWCFASLLDSSFLHLSCCSLFIVFYVTAMWHDHFGCILDSDTFQLPNCTFNMQKMVKENSQGQLFQILDTAINQKKKKKFSVIGTLRKDSHALRLALSPRNMSRTVLPHPSKVHVFLSKLMGGTMVFWMLWRAKHDWADIVVSTCLGLVEYSTRMWQLNWV